MKIYTRNGDEGETGLLYGGKVSKDSPLPEAYGTVDEAQAILGLVRTECEKDSDLEQKIIHIERDLYVLMAELATDPSKHDKLESGKNKVNEEMINFLEKFIDEISSRFELPQEFVIPGRNRISALIDVARTVVRRAERRTISCEIKDSLVVPYLNRLSDLLWAMARWQEGESIKSRSVK
ncbi:MAG: cob(I)yrinic acid a,c-diamide adenosyltransferase [Candidatus Marinimicrobia bacterium]|nr:cob(I)yrinic acid a,c-diamide adenosyltransferase [Candidatus Neomarinimicrobiota bacterium]